jgi:hypothetical protein
MVISSYEKHHNYALFFITWVSNFNFFCTFSINLEANQYTLQSRLNFCILKHLVLFLPQLNNISLVVQQLLLKLWWNPLVDECLMPKWQSFMAQESVTPTFPSFKICYSNWFGSFCCLRLHSLLCDSHPFCTRLFVEMEDCSMHSKIPFFLWPFGALRRCPT